MGDTSNVTPISPQAEVEGAITRASILNWNCSAEHDPKKLARLARSASALTSLAVRGLMHSDDLGDSGAGPDHARELVSELVELTDLLTFCLARELGAEDDDEKGGE